MKLNKSFLAAALGVCAVGQVQAGFYVSDDAPTITAAHPEAAHRNKTVYASFAGSKLEGASRAELESAADEMPNPDTVVITTFARTAKQMASANHRIASVKAVLIRRGISPGRIEGSAALDPQADSLDTDVQVTFRVSTQRPTIEALRAARLVIPAPVQPTPTPAATYTYAAPPMTTPTVQVGPTAGYASQNAAKLEFVKKIMAMSESKLISQASAVKLVNEYLSNMAPGQNPSADLPQQNAQGSPAAPQIVPFGEIPRVWTLAANKSLRDNIREWSLAAGYGEPAWNASNLYQVTYTSTYTGTFLEVLNQVSNSVPALDFRVSRNTHRLDVVDHM